DAQFGRATCLQGFFRKRFGRHFRGFEKREGKVKKTSSLSGGAGEKACFRDGASNRLAGKLGGISDKVKWRQTSGGIFNRSRPGSQRIIKPVIAPMEMKGYGQET